MSAGLAWKTAAFLLVVPGTVAGVGPLAVALCCRDGLAMSLGAWRWAGAPLLVVGGAVYLRCCIELVRRGHGIPAPTEPTRFLVHSATHEPPTPSLHPATRRRGTQRGTSRQYRS